MTTPSLFGPLQYCAGWVLLLVQSGWKNHQEQRSQSLMVRLTLTPHLNGDILLPTTGSWLISRISLFFKMLRTSDVTADSWQSVDQAYSGILWPGHSRLYRSIDRNGILSKNDIDELQDDSHQQRRFHQRPGCEMRFGFFISQATVSTEGSLLKYYWVWVFF